MLRSNQFKFEFIDKNKLYFKGATKKLHFIFIDASTFFLYVDRQKIIDSCKKKIKTFLILYVWELFYSMRNFKFTLKMSLLTQTNYDPNHKLLNTTALFLYHNFFSFSRRG